MRLLVSNAYSAGNAGDGLLVDQSVSMVQEVDPKSEVQVVAVQPATFPGLDCIGLRVDSESSPLAVMQAGLKTLHRPDSIFGDALSEFDAALAVGGGYLRLPRSRSGAQAFVVHVSQIRALAASRKEFGLLPQSIGPVVLGRSTLARALAKARFICVRDDRSLAELRDLPNVYRVPDLAILEIARQEVAASALEEDGTPTGRAVFVSRGLETANWNERAALLIEGSGTDVVALQSDAGRRNDDRVHYGTLGLKPVGSLSSLLASEGASVVVSVRLHGALMAILNGVPAVHLAYERKGFGAFEDLGLGDYVHNVSSVSAGTIRDQVQELRTRRGSRKYFERVAARTRVLQQSRSGLLRLIEDLLVSAAR